MLSLFCGIIGHRWVDHYDRRLPRGVNWYVGGSPLTCERCGRRRG